MVVVARSILYNYLSISFSCDDRLFGERKTRSLGRDEKWKTTLLSSMVLNSRSDRALSVESFISTFKQVVPSNCICNVLTCRYQVVFRYFRFWNDVVSDRIVPLSSLLTLIREFVHLAGTSTYGSNSWDWCHSFPCGHTVTEIWQSGKLPWPFSDLLVYVTLETTYLI